MYKQTQAAHLHYRDLLGATSCLLLSAPVRQKQACRARRQCGGILFGYYALNNLEAIENPISIELECVLFFFQFII